MMDARKHCGRKRAQRHQRGMSLVELMVGITIGLFIVAAATLLVGNQLTDNRRLLLETQLQQDMRATMDIITRQVRRAGALEPGRSQELLASDSGAPGIRNEPALQIVQPNPDEIQLQYFLTLASRNFGFQQLGSVVRSFLGESGWQELTDPNAVTVTKLEFTRIEDTAPNTSRESVVIPCPKLCPAPHTERSCWPTVQVRGYVVTLEAHSRSDPNVKRRLQSEVRVGNDYLKFNTGIAGQACPS